MSRNTVINQFESVYLRQNTCIRAFENKTNLKDFMQSESYTKCIKHVCNLTFNKKQKILLSAGFDYDDLYQVLSILGLQFNYDSMKSKQTKDISFVFMKFLNNQLENFFIHLDRKFKHSEKIELVPLTTYLSNNTSETVINKSTNKPTRMPIKKLKQLKNTLINNIELYETKLAEIATSKFVDYKLRKRARFICRRYNINYTKWAKDQISSRSLNVDDFCIGEL